MKLLRLVFAFITIFVISCSLIVTPSVHAIEPFEPFSKEGNPPEQYYYEQIFSLFRYIKPPQMKVYENRDRSRNYQEFVVCSGSTYDKRDYECDNVDNGCDGGDVGICRTNSPGGPPNHYAHSGNGSCSANKQDPPGTIGKCRYRQTPKISGELKATDFSAENRSQSSSSTPDTTTQNTTTTDQTTADTALGPYSSLVFPKVQNEAGRFTNLGSQDNALTWGSQRLELTGDDQQIAQLLVLYRAKQTKNTVSQTGEWPLGWVDWGYKTQNGKTLLDIYNELPGAVTGPAKVIAEGNDDFFLNAGNLDAVSDTSQARKAAALAFDAASSEKSQPEWFKDLLQTPVYPPSFRQGYARVSICVWDKCCPGIFCPFPDAVFGQAKGLYGDISISQAFNASLYDLLYNYPLDEAAKTFRKLAEGNPLIRFAGSSSPNAIPSVIHERLSREIKDKCLQYVPGPEDFTLGRFGFIMDYANPPTYLDPEKKCPGWAIQPELTQQQGGAFPQSLLSKLVSLIWGGGTVDDVDMVKKHYITIPDAMGQFISEIQEPVYDIRDSVEENEKEKKYNSTISNIVDSTTEYLTAGKGLPVGDAKTRISKYFTCDDPLYSQGEQTSIEQYALGTRIGCYQSNTSSGMCDGKRWNDTIGDTSQMPLPQAVTTIMSSKMFVNGALNPDLAQAYAQVEKETGVPCEVLAAHHFEEATNSFFGSNDPAQFSAANGGYVGKSGFLESVRNSAKGVLRHPPSSIETLITEMSDYNGGGNANCQTSLPYKVPYGGCPRQFIGDDDPYATNMLDSRHTNMYLIYCGDFGLCNPPKPYGADRPGAMAAALVVHNVIKSGTTTPASASPSPSGSPLPGGKGKLDVNPVGKCGDGYIDTGLGCIPYNRDAFVSALLSFIIGISGLLSLGSMGVAIFQIMTASGDKKQLQKGKELFAAAVAGLLFVVFSVTLLRIIAGDIIKLPGF